MASSGVGERTYGIDEYARLREPDAFRSELVRGRLVREPRPGARHGRVQAEVAALLREHARADELGIVLVDVGIVLSEAPPTVRGPDVAFLRADRVPDPLPEGFLEVVPDLVVEVLSPGNPASEIRAKVLGHLDAGCPLVWIVDPGTGSVTVHRAGGEVRILRADDVLDGGEALPGLALDVRALFGG